MARIAINPSEELAYAEFKTEAYTAQATEYENMLDMWTGMNDDSGYAKQQIAELRIKINLVRALIGFWRGEVSWWKSEINEIKTALKESNKLSSIS